jgi:hypothetical protein
MQTSTRQVLNRKTLRLIIAAFAGAFLGTFIMEMADLHIIVVFAASTACVAMERRRIKDEQKLKGRSKQI